MIKCSVWSCAEQSKGNCWKYSEIEGDFGKVSKNYYLASPKEKKNVVQEIWIERMYFPSLYYQCARQTEGQLFRRTLCSLTLI